MYDLLEAFNELNNLNKTNIQEAIKRFSNKRFIVADRSGLRDYEIHFLQDAQLVDINNNPIIGFHGSNYYDGLNYSNAGTYAETDTYFFSSSPNFASYYTDHDGPEQYFINCKNVFDWRNRENRLTLCNAADSFICSGKKASPKIFNKILQSGGGKFNSTTEDFDGLTKYKLFEKIKAPGYLFNASEAQKIAFPNQCYFIDYNKTTTELVFLKLKDIKLNNFSNIGFIKDEEILNLLTSENVSKLKQGKAIEIELPITLLKQGLEDSSRDKFAKSTLDELENFPDTEITCTISPTKVNMLDTFGSINNTNAKLDIGHLIEDTLVIKNNTEYNLIDFIKAVGFDGIFISEESNLNLIIFDSNNVRLCPYEI